MTPKELDEFTTYLGRLERCLHKAEIEIAGHRAAKQFAKLAGDVGAVRQAIGKLAGRRATTPAAPSAPAEPPVDVPALRARIAKRADPNSRGAELADAEAAREELEALAVKRIGAKAARPGLPQFFRWGHQ